MRLCVFVFILVLTAFKSRFSVQDLLHFLSHPLHQNCLNLLPQRSKALPELQALVCGENFSEMSESYLYITTGLIHLFVVSGAHLLVIRWILNFLFGAEVFTLVFLIFYSAVCEFNPPITRALIFLILTSAWLWRQNFWPSHFKVFITGLLSLVFQPQWASSLSLQLGWLIALGGVITLELLHERHALLKQAFLFTLIFPTLLLFQVPNPFSLLVHLIFSAALEFFLFPLALLVFFFPPLYPFFDFVIDLLKTVLIQTEIPLVPSELQKNTFILMLNWVLILGLHASLHLWLMRKKRRSEI